MSSIGNGKRLDPQIVELDQSPLPKYMPEERMTTDETIRRVCAVGEATYRTIPRRQFWFMIYTLLLAMITAGLQAEIIGDAATTIAAKFDAEVNISWMASSGFLVQACTLLIFGKLYDLLEPKKIMLTSLVFFTGGSVMSGQASTFAVLIIGQAIAGLGRSGIVVGCVIILGIITTSRAQRAFFVSVVSAGYGTMLKIAPLVAGMLLKKESKDQWRWIFWVAVPFQLLLIILVSIFPTLRRRRSTWQQFFQFDFVGGFLQAAGLVLFIIPLLIGSPHGSFSWTSPPLISLYILTPIMLTAFILWELRQPEHARFIPLNAIRHNRSIYLLAITTFVASLLVSASTFWLPSYLQYVRGSSPIVSALQMLPAVLIGSIASVVVGKCLALGGSRTYQFICIFGSILQIVGGACFWLFKYDMPYGQFYIDTITSSIGVGCTFAIGITLVLDLVPEELFGQVSSFMQIASALGALLGIAIQGVIVETGIETFLIPFGGTDALKAFKQVGQQNDSIIKRDTDSLFDTSSLFDASEFALESKIAYHNTQRQASLFYAAAGVLSLLASLALTRHIVYVAPKNRFEEETGSEHRSSRSTPYLTPLGPQSLDNQEKIKTPAMSPNSEKRLPAAPEQIELTNSTDTNVALSKKEILMAPPISDAVTEPVSQQLSKDLPVIPLPPLAKVLRKAVSF